MEEPLFKFENVTIKNNGNTVFTGLSFAIKHGEQWAITGNSGSGKTTLLEAIAGKLPVLNGSVQRSLSAAMVSADAQFRNLSNTTTFYHQQRFNSMDAEDALTVAQHLKSVQKTSGNSYWTLDKTISKLDLDHLKDKPIIMLSNGETRRLLLAEALLKDPGLLVLDNPLLGMDTQKRSGFTALLQEIIASGIHVIMAVSPTESPEGITHIAVVENGAITARMPIVEFNPKQFPLNETQINKTLINKLLPEKIPHYSSSIGMKGVTIRYGDKTILNSINWDVQQGERWSLTGPNGAGKSTLLSLVNADNPQAYSQDITLFEKRRGTGESIWDIKKKIGFVSAELVQYFPAESTCGHVIESGLYDTMGLFRKPSGKNAKAVNGWMQLLGLEANNNKLFSHAPVSVQRLCLLARAMIKNPALLILDEPCQGMDAGQKAYFKTLIDTICQNTAMTLIYVSHYTDEVPGCVTKHIVLNNGKRTDL